MPSSLPGHSAERMRRFYTEAKTAPAEGGFALKLDGRTPRSPRGLPLVLPATMPATRLTWTALATAEPGARQVSVERIAAFAGSDLLCYFADWPAALRARQERDWGPVIDWAERELAVSFVRALGVMHQAQPEATVARIAALAEAEDNFALAGLTAATALFGSAILAFALRRGHLTADAAFALARLDETFQQEQWGADREAAARAEGMATEAEMLGRWFGALEDRTA
jgi:chaperone required for assembly of F1-ATPase